LPPPDPATRVQVAAALCQVKNVSGVPDSYVVNAQQPEENSPIALSQTCTNAGIGLIPEGVRSYLYFVDLDGQTLIGTTYDMQGQRYQRNKQVLDQMMNSLNFNR